MLRSIRWSVPLVVCLAAACDAAGPRAEVEVRDSLGVRVVEVPTGVALPEWMLPDRAAVVIGDMAAGEDYELYQPIHALRLEDGRIVIANQGTQELRFYSADGRHLRTAGRRGGGPGEFEDMWGLARLPGDSLGVWDFTARRLTIYDDAGDMGRMVSPAGDVGFVPRLLGAFGDGSFAVVRGFNPSAVFARGGGILDDSVVVLRFSSRDGAVLDSLGPFPGDQRYVHMGEGQFWMRRVTFGRAERLALAAGHIHVGDDRTGEVRSHAPDGGLARILRLEHDPAPATEDRVTRHVADQLESVPPERRQEERRRARQVPVADAMPAFADLFADRLGRVWLREESAPSPRDSGSWIVHAADGRPAARIRLPARTRPVDAGADYLLLYGRDELDVERIMLFDLETWDASP